MCYEKEFQRNRDLRIMCFIEMLNEGNDRILKQRNSETLKGYPSINLADFWSHYQDKIKSKIFVELKDNPKYEKARE